MSICGQRRRRAAQYGRFVTRLEIRLGSREETAILAVRDGARKQSGGGERGPLPPPALASVLRVGRLAVKASPAAAWRRRFSPCRRSIAGQPVAVGAEGHAMAAVCPFEGEQFLAGLGIPHLHFAALTDRRLPSGLKPRRCLPSLEAEEFLTGLTSTACTCAP